MSDTTAGDEREALVAVIMSSFAAATVAARAEGFADAILAAGWRRDGVDPDALREWADLVRANAATEKASTRFRGVEKVYADGLADGVTEAANSLTALLGIPAAGHETGGQT